MKNRGFTLVELLVVIAIIGLLSTVAVVATSSAGVNARNTTRKADMTQVSKALELYYADHNAYPSTDGNANWIGSCTTYGSLPNVDPADYPTHYSWIPGLTDGGYMANLPNDPHTNQSHSQTAWCVQNSTFACYIYTSDGINYKLISHCIPEGTLSASDPFIDNGRAHSWSIYSPGAKDW